MRDERVDSGRVYEKAVVDRRVFFSQIMSVILRYGNNRQFVSSGTCLILLHTILGSGLGVL